MTYRIGLTGGIGSGKSTVAALFAELGAAVIDTDLISHRLTAADGLAIPAIRAAFGDAFVNAEGALDRARMRELIFSAPPARLQLEGILHPMIRAEAKTEVEASATPYTVLVVPLLFEAQGYRDWLHRTVAVDCPESLQIARTMQRSHLDESAVRAIMAQQLGRQQRLKQADDIVSNDGDQAALPSQVRRLHEAYLLLAAGSD
ncbi:MAG: dephospho-CoA kinase [Nitrosomonadales bacterium]|nr:dephospho-CoA kinase [Nitrosomonadales bacterium]